MQEHASDEKTRTGRSDDFVNYDREAVEQLNQIMSRESLLSMQNPLSRKSTSQIKSPTLNKSSTRNLVRRSVVPATVAGLTSGLMSPTSWAINSPTYTTFIVGEHENNDVKLQD